MPEITLDQIIGRYKNPAALSAVNGCIAVPKDELLDLMRFLKDVLEFRMLSALTSADYEDRYELVYYVSDMEAHMVCVKLGLPKDDAVAPSLTPVWRAADVQEREVYDLMGIVFEGHPNLKRILCHDDFYGHPLRKSYQLRPVDRFSAAR